MPHHSYQGVHLSTSSIPCSLPRAACANLSCSVIFNDPDKAGKLYPVPVLQCLQIKQMAPNPQGEERYRLVLSDGTHYVQTMLALQANHVVHEGKLVRGCIVRLKQYTPNNHKGKK